MSDEDRLVLDEDIVWYSSSKVTTNKGAFNFYITTDFATSESKASDFSVISVWAYNNNGDWLLVDGICKRQLMNHNIDDLFRLVSMYKPQQVGIEVSGQQGGFISWIYDQMMTRNVYFTLASENNNGKSGLRPNTNKMERFNIVIPWFKTKKIWLPEDKKDSKLLVELLEELRYASPKGFKSKHDDVIDTVSMLASLTPWKPSEVTVNDDTGLWEDDDMQDSNSTSSYIV
jgi:predicted phage terminase large subunit-like protein